MFLAGPARLALVLAALAPSPAPEPTDPHLVRGMTISCQGWGAEWGTDRFAAELDELAALGVNWIAIHPYAFLKRDGSLAWRDLDPETPPEWLARPVREAAARGLSINGLVAEVDAGRDPEAPGNLSSALRVLVLEDALHSSGKSAGFSCASAVSAAEPIAKPLPMAAVVLPTASSLSVRSRTSAGSSAISAQPPALSAIGPYASTASWIPVVASMPSAAMAMP